MSKKLDDLIRIEDAIKVLCRKTCHPGALCPDSYCVEMWDEFKDVEQVDAVPVVHGRWQWISSTYDRIPCEKRYWCSKCHHETITHDSEPWEKFCPNCGAKMDGKNGEQA